MSNFMKLAGIVLAISGAVLAGLTFYKPGIMDVYGIKLDTAAILFVGGILSLGLGGLISAVSTRSRQFRVTDSPSSERASDAPASTSAFGRKSAEAAATASAVTTIGAAIASSSKTTDAAKTSVADTIAALDQAKSDIRTALGGMESMTAPVEEMKPITIPSRPSPPILQTPAVSLPTTRTTVVEPEPEEMDTDPELFVVEEKIIRGRPARILSDETVEAETDEGWMRFENLEHLNEYIDSLEETEA